MRISDWSSDVCSSDLLDLARLKNGQVIRSWASRAATSPGTDRNRSSWVRSAKREDARRVTEFSLRPDGAWLGKRCRYRDRRSTGGFRAWPRHRERDRKSVGAGKSVAVRLIHSGARFIKKKKKNKKKQSK